MNSFSYIPSPHCAPAPLTPDMRQFNTSGIRGAAIRRYVDDGLKLETIVELPLFQTLRAELVQRAPYAGFAGINALQTQFHGRVGGEQVRDVVPHLPVHVIPVDVLQILHFRFIVQDLCPPGKIRHPPA